MSPIQRQFDHIYRSNVMPSAKGQQRVAWLVSHVPSEVVQILDLGAGRGRIANALKERGHRVVALDFSLAGLQQCEALKVQSSVAHLPFRTSTYDLVICSEVLEHLTPELRTATLREMDRVSRRYILITVPNNEDLRVMQVKCNHCQSIFHAHGHLTSFTLASVAGLLPYRPVKLLTSGHAERGWRVPLLVLRHRVLGCYAWDEFLMCPTCHSAALQPPHRSLAVKIVDKLNHLMAPEREAVWLLGLFDKQTGSAGSSGWI
jgi:SAM-dependent methyltransferase